MTDLATLLANPIVAGNAATDPDVQSFLDDLQANILKGHGRSHAAHVFLSFAGMPADAVATLLRAFSRHCTSAARQLRTNRRNPPFLDGGPVRCLFLSASGYQALAALATVPVGAAFAAGMAARTATLNDPPRAAWQAAGWQDGQPVVDAMLLLANSCLETIDHDLDGIEEWLNGSGARILVIERGLQQHKTFDPAIGPLGVEHFGYVDGRSQPLFLKEDLDRELATAGGANWSPKFDPSQFIVADPNGRSPLSAGSFFVFRKLEQNVRGFAQAEEHLADALGLAGDDRERAGAMVVGRFEDGTPLALAKDATGHAPPNDFNFTADPDVASGLKCPFHAHIRKSNPRDDLPNPAGRNRIMARRGITYGVRPMLPDGSDFADAGNEPAADVGLLFMAYMASIETQFEFTQQSWVNSPGFRNPGTGIDPIIGQNPTAGSGGHTYQDGWTAGAQPTPFTFANFVTLKGGEYFFAPSLSFLRSVGL